VHACVCGLAQNGGTRVQTRVQNGVNTCAIWRAHIWKCWSQMDINATTSLTDNTAAQAEMLAIFACVQGQHRPTPARATFTTHGALTVKLQIYIVYTYNNTCPLDQKGAHRKQYNKHQARTVAQHINLPRAPGTAMGWKGQQSDTGWGCTFSVAHKSCTVRDERFHAP
jgi:hypothetical protein